MDNHTPAPWATDGRMIVQEVDGRSFWTGQPFIADCIVSQSTRGEANTTANARFIIRAVNSHSALVEALELARATIERIKPAHTHGPFSTVQGTLDVINSALTEERRLM